MSSFIETIVQNWAPIGVMSFFVMSFIRQSKQVQKLIEELKEKENDSQQGRNSYALYYKLSQLENNVLDLQDQYYALAHKYNELAFKDVVSPVVCPPISLDAIRDTVIKNKI